MLYNPKVNSEFISSAFDDVVPLQWANVLMSSIWNLDDRCYCQIVSNMDISSILCSDNNLLYLLFLVLLVHLADAILKGLQLTYAHFLHVFHFWNKETDLCKEGRHRQYSYTKTSCEVRPHFKNGVFTFFYHFTKMHLRFFSTPPTTWFSSAFIWKVW